MAAGFGFIILALLWAVLIIDGRIVLYSESGREITQSGLWLGVALFSFIGVLSILEHLNKER